MDYWALDRTTTNELYQHLIARAKDKGPEQVRQVTAQLGLRDLFFLLTRILRRPDINRDWLFERCREVQADPDGYLDLWAREHYKSTIITFGLTIQDLLNDSELTVGIFSHTKSIARDFVKQIKGEFETNELLPQLYPDVCWADPKRESPRWSVDRGIVLKRKSNPKEASVEGHGLVDGQPTSKHFRLLVYDDVVTLESVGTPEMIQKTTDAWSVSLNLGAHGGRKRHIGTFYHYADTWREIIRRGAAVPRVHPATKDGTPEGEPVFLTREQVAEKRREQGPYTFACQQLLDPKADETQGFVEDWLIYYEPTEARSWDGHNLYLLCDPAGEKKKVNDYTVAVVLALGPDGNYYLVDGVRDRLNLVQRTRLLFRFHKKYRRHIRGVGYERFGKDSDIEHIQSEMERLNYRFEITTISRPVPKFDRIRKLIPPFSAHRFWIPWRLHFLDYEGRQHDFIQEFVDEEYLAFPVAAHDDMLDCMANILNEDLGATFPLPDETPLGQDGAITEYDIFGGGKL